MRGRGGAGAALFSLVTVTGLKEMAEAVLCWILGKGSLLRVWLGTRKGISVPSKVFTAPSLSEFNKHLDKALRLMA